MSTPAGLSRHHCRDAVDGKIAAWKYKVTGSSVMARWFPAGFANGIDIDAVDSAVDMPYDIPISMSNMYAPSHPA